MSCSIWHNITSDLIRRIKDGGIVAHPTEAVYGLACVADNKNATQRLRKLKQRETGKGFIVITDDWSRVTSWIDMTQHHKKFEEIFLLPPSNTTWIFPASTTAPHAIRTANGTIAIRLPDHDLALELCQRSEAALVSTSANLKGMMALRNGEAVCEALGDSIDGILIAPVGGNAQPSILKDAITGEIIAR